MNPSNEVTERAAFLAHFPTARWDEEEQEFHPLIFNGAFIGWLARASLPPASAEPTQDERHHEEGVAKLMASADRFKQGACSACYGTGYGVDGKPCPCGCRPAATQPAAPEMQASHGAVHYGLVAFGHLLIDARENQIIDAGEANELAKLGPSYFTQASHVPRFDQAEFDALVEKGTKAWSGAGNFVGELRGPAPSAATIKDSLTVAGASAGSAAGMSREQIIDIAGDYLAQGEMLRFEDQLDSAIAAMPPKEA